MIYAARLSKTYACIDADLGTKGARVELRTPTSERPCVTPTRRQRHHQRWESQGWDACTPLLSYLVCMCLKDVYKAAFVQDALSFSRLEQ